MLVSQCPRCHEPVRVPHRLVSGDSVGEDLRIQCPWCSETLSGSEVLSRVPPALVMVGADGSEVADIDGAVMDVSTFDTQAAWGKPQRAQEFQDLGFTPSAPARTRVKSDAPVDVMMDLNSTKTPTRRSSPVRQMISVVVGGLLACGLVTGLMIVAGKPLPNFGFYPYDGSFDPPVPRRSAAVVPATEVPRNDGPIPVGRSLGEDLPPPSISTDPAKEAAAAIAASTSTNPAADAEVSEDPETLFEDAVMTPKIELAPLPTEETPVVDTTPDFSTVGIPPDMKLNTLENTAMAPPATEEVVTVTVDEVLEAFVSLPPSGDPGRQNALQTAYSDLAKLAATADEDSLSDLQSVLDTLKKDQSFVRELALYAPQWIAKSQKDRGTDGVVVVAGKVTVDGDRAELQLPGGKSMSAKLPMGFDTVPTGVQIGVGTVIQTDDQSSIELKSLQPLAD